MLVRCFCLLLVFHCTAGVIAAAPPVREPVAVVYLSSLDGVMDDIDYIVSAGDRPELSQKLKDLVASLNHLDGLNRTQPVGVFAFLPLDIASGNKDPELVGFLPITDMELLKKTVSSTSSLAATASDKPNRYELKVAGKSYQALVDQGHLLFTERVELLDQPLPTPDSLTSPLAGQYDIVIQIRKQGVPRILWDMVLLGALSASDQELKELRKSRAPADVLKVRGFELARQSLVAVMSEAQSVWLGLRVSRESRNAVLDLKFEFTDSGKVAKTLNKMASGSIAIAKGAEGDVPANFHLHLTCPDEAKQLIVDLGRLVREQHDPSESIPEPQRATVSALVDVAQQTLGAGEYEVLVQFVGQTEGGMTLVVGVQVADGNKLSDAVQKLLPEAVNKGDVAGVTLDAGNARGVNFARIDGRVKDPDHERKVEAFYGGKPSLYVGTDPTTLWLLVGDEDALNDFSRVPVLAARTTEGEDPASMVRVGVHLSDWMGLLSLTKGRKDREFTEAARAALKEPERDELRLTVQPVSDGLQISLLLDEAYLNLISAAMCKE